MERETELLDAIEQAEKKLNYMLVFEQETGEEAVVHGMTVDQARERYPEWCYRYREAVKDEAFYEWRGAVENYRFWQDTKDLSEEDYEEYLDSMNEYSEDYYY